MIESNVTQKLIALMKLRGYLCRKMADQFTAGHPDMWFVRKGQAGFLELKLFKSDKPPAAINFASHLRPSPQSATMLDIEARGVWSRYLVFHDGVHCAEFKPSDVHNSITSTTGPVRAEWMEVEEWIKKLPF